VGRILDLGRFPAVFVYMMKIVFMIGCWNKETELKIVQLKNIK
jgi:hypothetical protein